MKTRIIILARDCDSTNIVYNYLKHFFTIDAVVYEETIPRKDQFHRRAKRLGYPAAISQAIFFLAIFPLIKLFSKKRKKEINGVDNKRQRHSKESIYLIVKENGSQKKIAASWAKIV